MRVALFAERVFPGADIGCTFAQRVRVEPGRAQLELRIVAMGDDVHRVELVVAGQGLVDLFDAVAGGIEDHDVHIAALLLRLDHIVVELLEVGRARVDDDKLVAIAF